MLNSVFTTICMILIAIALIAIVTMQVMEAQTFSLFQQFMS